MRPARENPFRSEAIDALAYTPGGHVENLFRALPGQQFRGQIIGAKGTGKTTLLRDLQRLLENHHTLVSMRLTEDFPGFTKNQWAQLTSSSKNTLVIIDGAEQLTSRHQKKLVRISKRWGGLILTSHQNLRKYEKTLPVLCVTRPNAEEFTILAQELDPSLTGDKTEELYTLHNGNLRNAFRHLYDLWADDEV